MIETPFFAALGLDNKMKTEFEQWSSQVYPMKRIGTVADTTNAILFLASDQVSFTSYYKQELYTLLSINFRHRSTLE